jgi:hypothetical protein
MANLSPVSNVAPNEPIEPHRVFMPDAHRAVLDLGRQLVVGNRGMGKSFWTHAIMNQETRSNLADVYGIQQLLKVLPILGYNASDSVSSSGPTPTRGAITAAIKRGHDPKTIWRAVILDSVRFVAHKQLPLSLDETISRLQDNEQAYEAEMSILDEALLNKNIFALVLFDALDRLDDDNWDRIRELSRALFQLALSIRSFRAIRLKIFIRPDQFAAKQQFSFSDSSKITNDVVDLRWTREDLYRLLFFELLQSPSAASNLRTLAKISDSESALAIGGKRVTVSEAHIRTLVEKLAGEFMGSNRRRGFVYSWVPLHLSDAEQSCSPRAFLNAWRSAAIHSPAPTLQAVDHHGLNEGVRSASTLRLNELEEDYPWIVHALDALKGRRVPMLRQDFVEAWRAHSVIEKIRESEQTQGRLAPIGNDERSDDPEALIAVMKAIAVIEVRGNGKINVPDIFRTAAGILRTGGVAVPKRR